MKLFVFTIVLDGMPWLPCIYSALNGSATDWQWIVVEGVAKNVLCSSHCREIAPRLSRDGTSEFLESIRGHRRVRIIQRELWQGKIEMCNAALSLIDEPCLLMQVDADELWRAEQLEKLVAVADEWTIGTMARFFCRYYVGPDIIIIGDDCYGNTSVDWNRAWTYQKGMRFSCHCPPIIPEANQRIGRDETRSVGLVFNHYAYVTEEQVEFKERYYGYQGAVEGWKRLQQNTVWPAKLKTFLPWSDDKAEAIRL